MQPMIANTIHRVLAPKELNSSTVTAFKEQTHKSLSADIEVLDVDLRTTVFMDSTGLGALISFNKKMASQGGVVRLLNPAPAVQQILELTRMHRIFEINRD